MATTSSALVATELSRDRRDDDMFSRQDRCMTRLFSSEATTNRTNNGWPIEAPSRHSVIAGTELPLPETPGTRIKPVILLELVDAEVAKLCANDKPSGLRAARTLGRREMLGILTFAYASRLFENEDIVCRCRTELVFRLLNNGIPPFAYELTCFRRRNRKLLEAALVSVMSRIAENNLTGSALSSAFQLQLASEVTRRLDMAWQMDCCNE